MLRFTDMTCIISDIIVYSSAICTSLIKRNACICTPVFGYRQHNSLEIQIDVSSFFFQVSFTCFLVLQLYMNCGKTVSTFLLSTYFCFGYFYKFIQIKRVLVIVALCGGITLIHFLTLL